MKGNLILLAIILVLVLPSFLIKPIEDEEVEDNQSREEIGESASVCSIRVKDNDEVKELAFEEYVLGVVLGEMPASFEEDALKAQAVATRTYTLRRVEKQSKHFEADICTDATCCQAYLSKDDYLSTRGTEQDYNKIKAAVSETRAQVLFYQGGLIEATYFSCSGGMTEDAVAVWGSEVPYLSSVASPGEDKSKNFQSTIVYEKDDFLRRLALQHTEIDSNDIYISYTSGGGVKEMRLLGATYSGTQVRQLLNLPSTAFSITVGDDDIIINTKGYGHRVGMSQYGADAMALNGSSYEEILSHYYQGTTLVQMTEEQMKALFDKEENL